MRCKCCGGASVAFAALDFSRSCEDDKKAPFARSGEMVPYNQCTKCGFVFTSYFDHWSSEQMTDRIYNADYALADPGFADARPAAFAKALTNWLFQLRQSIAALDYGGGQGALSGLMRQKGFDYENFDPYFSNNGAPQRRYELVTSFEVVEHSTNPFKTFSEMLSYLTPNGAVLFSTNLLPLKATSDWWYIAPRNGHVSIYTAHGLQTLARRLGVRFLTIAEHIHLFYRTTNDPITRKLLSHNVNDMLWQASRQNWGALTAAALATIQLNRPLTALNPRHVARLFFGERRAENE